VVSDRLPSRNLKSRGRSRIYAQRKASKKEASGNRGSLSKNREDLKLDQNKYGQLMESIREEEVC